MLRDHDIARTPFPVDRTQKTSVPTPGAWTRELADGEVEVLPVGRDPEATYRDGWCTYTYVHEQAPELEVICGGINTKTPRAAAIWRQGHLLHFGFEPSPDQLNENGRALLLNSIHYIARFTEDRPLVRTPSIFYSRVLYVDRGILDRVLNGDPDKIGVYLDRYLAGPTRARTRELSPAELKAWWSDNRRWVRADDEGKFHVDEQAREFGVAFDAPEFLQTAIAALAETTERSRLAAQLLQRYFPEGPGEDASVTDWTSWRARNESFLFYTETGGCCWLIDQLARKRQIPTARLRGPARASK